MPDGAVSAKAPGEREIREQLERTLADPLFRHSERLSAFFRFIVEETLAGRGKEIKEAVLGTEVFGRSPSYDPREDPVVRIMAGRLRGKLAEYYQSSGQADRLVISLPRGGYVPQATWRPVGFGAHVVATRVARSRSVGRGTELSELRTAFASTASGSGLAVILSGEAGVGKTTLAEEFLSGLATAGLGALIATGRCSEHLAETEAFVPILESLDDLLHREPSGDVAQRLKSTAPGWHAQVVQESGDDRSSQNKQTSPERMRREFVSFFEELSRDRPVVLFLDDVHWADPSTCDLLAYAGARLNRTRLLLLMAYRLAAVLTPEHALTKLKLDLERRGMCREISVSFLTADDVASYISMQFPGHAFLETLPQIVHQRTEGNALFMAEMLRHLQDQRILVEQDGVWTCILPVSEIGRAIPVGIRSMIRLKVQQVSEEDRILLLSAAVQGLQFDSAVVAKVLSWDPAVVEERLQALDAEHDFVRAAGEREFSDGTLSVRYRFIHVFYQHALYESLAPSRRTALSLKTACILVKLTGAGARGIAADIALLFEAGRDPANASEHFLQAARNAARVFAYAETATLCDRGLKALAALPESQERDKQELRFSLIHGLALMATRGFAAPEVEKTYARSRELCLLVDEKRRLLPVLWGLHTCYLNRGDLPSALAVAREMVGTTEDSVEPIARVEALHALGTTFVFMGRLREGRETLERIFEGYSVSDHMLQASIYVMDPCVTSLSFLALALALSGLLAQALEKAESAIELAQRLAHPPSLTYAMLWRGVVRHMRGENAQCSDDLEATMEMSRKHDLPLFLEWARIVRGSALGRMGRAEEAITEMRRSLERQSEMQSLIDRPYCLTLLAEALVARGARDEALKLCDEALEFTARTECRRYEPETHRIKGEVLLAVGEDSLLQAVAAEFATALRLARQAGCLLLELKAAESNFKLHRRLGDMRRARALLRTVVEQFTGGNESPSLLEARRLLGE
jgi:tetratricopeptide (TPR) repeat protein